MKDTAIYADTYFGVHVSALPTSEEVRAIRKTFKKHLVAFIESLPQNARLLDIGCGSGKTIKLVSALRPDIVIAGMDIMDMQKWLPEGVDFSQGSVDDLATLYTENSFDGVICQHVVEHLLYPTALVQGIQRILKPGGRAFIETPNWTRLFVPFSNLWFWADYTHIRPFARSSMHRLLNEFECKIISMQTVSSYKWFPKKVAVAVESTIPSSKKVSQDISARGVTARVCSRILNPMMRDILVAVFEKPR